MISIRRGLLLALLGAAAAPAAPAQPAASDTRPVIEHVLGWPAADTLHVSRYGVGGGCSASGFFAISVSTGARRPLRAGEGVCELIGTLHGTALTRDGTRAVGIRGFRPVVVDLADGTARPLSIPCRLPGFEPDLSPDGRTLAFDGACEAGVDRFAIHTIPLAGGAHRTVRSEPGNMLMAPRWSPDGRSLAYLRTPEPGSGNADRDRIAIVAADGGEPRLLESGGIPAWSPDGAWLAYLSGGEALHVVAADGSGDRVVFRHRGQPRRSDGQPGGSLAWSPDGEWIAFSRAHPDGQSVWRVHVATGRLEQVTRHPHEAR